MYTCVAPCLSSASETTKGLNQLNCKIAGRELRVTALAFNKHRKDKGL